MHVESYLQCDSWPGFYTRMSDSPNWLGTLGVWTEWRPHFSRYILIIRLYPMSVVNSVSKNS